VKVWSTRDWQSQIIVRHDTPSDVVVFSPDSEWIASVGKDSAAVWHRQSGQRVAECRADGRSTASANLGERGSVRPLAVSGTLPRGTWASRICRSGSVLRAVGLTAFSPDAGRVLTWEQNKMSVRDSESWQSLLEVGDPSANIAYAAFSANGACIVTAGEDRRGSASPEHAAWVWDARTGARLLELQGHHNLLTRAAFSPDSQRVATVGTDRTVRTYRIRMCGTFPELVAQADVRLGQKRAQGR
jgi:WD40 repeat protein